MYCAVVPRIYLLNLHCMYIFNEHAKSALNHLSGNWHGNHCKESSAGNYM